MARAVRFALAVGLLLAAALLVPARGVSAHAELVRENPPSEGLVVAPPTHLDLWFSEDLAPSGSSVKLLDSAGKDVSPTTLTLDPTNHRHVTVSIPPLSAGTYTVVWTSRSADDGHVLTGSYAFRIGGGRAPGAATVQGQTPQIWAVATRWLTFLGVALTAGGFLFARVVTPGAEGDPPRRRRRALAVVVGSAVALIATLAEPVLQTLFPPAGAIAPTLDEAIRALPGAWWVRPAALIPVLLLGLWLLRTAAGRRRPPAAAEWAGLVLALVALLGLSLTGHGSGRAHLRALAAASDTLHVWAVALWVGGLAHLALAWPVYGELKVGEPSPVRRFSRLALPLVGVAVLTGALNAGLILPTLRSLWTSTYGEVLIGKSALLIPPLLLATFHRAALRGMIANAARRLRATVRLEAALVLLVVLGGSTLAMLAPPVSQAGVISQVALAAPAGGTLLEPEATIKLTFAPARPGKNELSVGVFDAKGAAIPPSQIQQVRLDFTSLDHDLTPPSVVARPSRDVFAVDGVQLSLDGWWRVVVTVQRADQSSLQTPFFFILPDPNVNGMGAAPTPASEPKAAAVFQRGLAGMTSLHRVRFTQVLSGGTGTQASGEFAVSDGTDGRPPAFSQSASDYQGITVGNQLWSRSPGQAWQQGPAGPIFLPKDWGEQYAGATSFQLGPIEMVDGEPCQVVTFRVPKTEEYQAAWFAWWVGVNTGRVRQETMVSTYHYMHNHYFDFNAPFAITPPTG